MSHMPAPPARNWSGWLFAAALMALVIASFATLSLKLGDLFTIEALRSMG